MALAFQSLLLSVNGQKQLLLTEDKQETTKSTTAKMPNAKMPNAKMPKDLATGKSDPGDK